MDTYSWAIVGVCLTIGLCALALVVFVLIFCRVRIKDDTNVRKRIITKKAFAEPEPEPEPVRQNTVAVPISDPAPPPPPQVILQRPAPIPIRTYQPTPPLPPPPPPEQRVIIREIIRDNPAPPQQQPPQPVERVVRRRSWSGANDDWVLVKKIKKRRGGKPKKSRSDVSDSSSSSSSDSSSDEEDTRHGRPSRHTPMAPVRYGVQRLDPYDLAVPSNPLYATRLAAPGMVSMVPAATANVVPFQAQAVVHGQPTVATAMVMPTMQTAQPGYVSMMVPQRM